MTMPLACNSILPFPVFRSFVCVFRLYCDCHVSEHVHPYSMGVVLCTAQDQVNVITL